MFSYSPDKHASRRDKLAKWKEERELKRKLQARVKERKPNFRVSHVEQEVIPFSKLQAQPKLPTVCGS